jgi:surface carbohydrate biosynthesis protein
MKAFLQFLQRAFKYFRNTKRVWRRPPRASLLIIDRGTASPLDEMFAHHKPQIMEIRGESVNMLALFRALPKIHLGAVAYLEAYIDFVKPKLILSRTDNNHTLWQLKRRPNVTYQVALVQNGWRIADSPGGETGKIGLYGNANVDCFFSVGEASRNAFRSEIKSSFIPIGSLNLNFFPKPTHDLKTKKTVSLVSVFRQKTSFDDQGINEFGGLERSLLLRGKDIAVICRSASHDECSDEEYFYQVALPNLKKEFLRKDSRLSSYKWLTSRNIILFDMSTFGYEALALGLRVACISFQPAYRTTDRFGLPLEFGEKGPFWTNDPSEEEIGRILDYLLNVSDEQWERDSGWIRDQLMVHDYGNTKIRAYVEGVLTDSLESK